MANTIKIMQRGLGTEKKVPFTVAGPVVLLSPTEGVTIVLTRMDVVDGVVTIGVTRGKGHNAPANARSGFNTYEYANIEESLREGLNFGLEGQGVLTEEVTRVHNKLVDAGWK